MGKLKTKNRNRARSKPGDKLPSYMDDVHRPVTCLFFLLPLVALYELGVFFVSGDMSSSADGRVIAFELFQNFLALFGASGYYLPGLAIIAILIAWQFAAGDRWKVNFRTLGKMAIESMLLALPLLVLSKVASNYATTMSATAASGQVPWLSDLLISVGAGIYEELLFRLILITVLSIVLIDVFNMDEGPAIFTIVLASAVIFSLYHYLGDESFGLHSFVFRSMAGGYLAGIFILRGFGITVGTHVCYDLAALFCNAFIFGEN